MEDQKRPSSNHSESDHENPEGAFQNKNGQQIVNKSKTVGTKRGRKAIPPQWSRIIEVDDVDIETLKIFEIEEDMARS